MNRAHARAAKAAGVGASPSAMIACLPSAPSPPRTASRAAGLRRLRRAIGGITIACGLGVLVGLPASTRAEQATATPALDSSDAWRSSQEAVGRQIGDFALLDRASRPVRLLDYRGKPLLVSFIYTGCFQVCPANTRALQESVQVLQKRFGEHRFNVVSIGFNQPADSPLAMKAFAAQQRIDSPDWDFLSPHPAVVKALTADFGFRAQATPAGFDHVLQLSIVDAQGRLVYQLYGDRAPSATLGEVLQRLFDGVPPPEPSTLSTLLDRVRLLCTRYDPETGTVRVDYSLAIEIAGGVTFLLAMLVYMFNEWRQRRRVARVRSSAKPEEQFE
ncbi:MAG: SCO family protein [Burkholderiaceae bacterium]